MVMEGGNNLPEWLFGQNGTNAAAIAALQSSVTTLSGKVVKFQANTSAASGNITGNVATPYNQTITIPAGRLAVGDRIEVSGVVDVVGVAGSPTCTNALQIGGQAAINGTAQDATAASFQRISATGIVRSIGASGVIAWDGQIGTVGDGRSSTVDTTGALIVRVLGNFSTTSGSNLASLLSLVVTVTPAVA